MTQALQKIETQSAQVAPTDLSAYALECAIGKNDLSGLGAADRLRYVAKLCELAGLNPLSQPIKIISLQGKPTLYADKSCAEQLRGIYKISVEIASREFQDGCYIVRARAKTPEGQVDESLGVVPCPANADPATRANAMMKAETKAKRRATLSLRGLGFLPDETELETMKTAQASPIEGVETAVDRAANLNKMLAEPAKSEVVVEPTNKAMEYVPNIDQDTLGKVLQVVGQNQASYSFLVEKGKLQPDDPWDMMSPKTAEYIINKSAEFLNKVAAWKGQQNG